MSMNPNFGPWPWSLTNFSSFVLGYNLWIRRVIYCSYLLIMIATGKLLHIFLVYKLKITLSMIVCMLDIYLVCVGVHVCMCDVITGNIWWDFCVPVSFINVHVYHENFIWKIKIWLCVFYFDSSSECVKHLPYLLHICFCIATSILFSLWHTHVVHITDF